MAKEKKYYNQPAAVARNCFIGAVIGVLVFFYPIVFPISTYGAGYALNMVGILIFLTGLISGFMFRGVAKNLDELVTGDGLLAHWTYGGDEWARYVEADHIRERRDKWGLFRLVAIIAVVVGVIFAVIVRGAWLSTLLTVGGLILIIALTAWLSIGAAYREKRLHPGDVYIGMSGALLGRSFHYWKLPASFLRNASLQAGDPMFVQLDYSSPSGRMQGEYTARFPVPQGREEEAKRVIAQLKGEQPQDQIVVEKD
jgi:hypothetical protein